ncbi:MAG TPA: hypothetical protein VFU13_10040 [Steroidobacteraceae bacterium]|nr:hypothetical protein [Steroidobacteraceae bacterium]
MAAPTFVSVSYIDPWGIVPPGTFNTGVLVTVSGTGAPSGYILIAQLLQSGQPLAYGIGGTATFLFVTPPGPLTDALPYQVLVQWAPNGTDPQNADWTDPGVISAPVLTSSVVPLGGSYDGGNLTLAWTPAGAAQPAFGVVQVVDTTGGVGKTFVQAGGSGQWAWSPTTGHAYALYLRAAALIDPSGGAGGPYTSGPYAPPVALPVASPTLSSVTYDGATLTVGWTPPTLPTSPVVANPSYSLIVSSGSTPVATFGATSAGGTAVVDLASIGTNVTVASATAYGSVGGPAGAAQAPIVAGPSIAGVTMAPSGTAGSTNITATVAAPPNLPSGAAVTAALLQNGTQVATGTAAGSPLSATLTYQLAAGASYAVVASASVASTSTTPAVTSPSSATLPIVTGTVSGITTSYDGARLHLAWTAVADPNVDGYQVTLSGGITGTYVTGVQPMLSIPVLLNVGAAATAAIRPLAGPVLGLSASGPAFTVPAPGAPVIVDVAVQGDAVTLAWSPSSGPWLDGYQVTLTGSAGGATTSTITLYTGLETAITTTLPAQTVATTWSATVAATARGTAGTASTAVALFPAVVLITGVSVSGTTATVNWSLSPNSAEVITALSGASASLQVQLLDASNVIAAQSTAITSTSTGTGSTTIALPASVTHRFTAAAQLVAAAQTGSRGGTVAVLSTTPTITFASLTDGALALSWSATGDEGVTGYTVTYGSLSATTSETNLTLPVPSATTGTISVTPIGAGTSGPAATQNVVPASTVASGSYSSGTLSVTLNASGTPTPDQFWVDVLVEGALAARTVVQGAPSAAVTVPVSIAPGSAAVVRATGIGGGSVTPSGTTVAIPSTPPNDISGVWDGTNVHVAWTPVPDFGVTGYLVTIGGTSTTIPTTYVAGASAPSTSIAATFSGAFPGSATVSVQSAVLVTTDNYMSGPASVVAIPSLASSVRSVAAAASSQPPFVYRRGIYSTLATADQANVIVYLANVFTNGTPTVKDSTTTFTLAPVATPVTGGPAYSLTIDKSAWTFDGSAARTTVRSAYRNLLIAVEAAGVQPWGVPLVRQAIATALPQTFAELLYYRYGIWQDASTRLLDLDSGMRLRVSGAVYQTVAASKDDRNGFVALGQQLYDLGEVFPAGSAQSVLAPALTMDAFLSQVIPGGGTPSGTTTIAASPMDFFGPGAREAYYRVFFPKAPGGTTDGTTFPGSGAIGSTSPTQNVAIVGASTWTALENATDSYASSGVFPTSGGLWIAYFRGRASLSPLISIAIGGTTRWVPAGTTLRQALASLGAAAAFGPSAATGISLTRPVVNVFDYSQGGATLRAESVDLSGIDLGTFTPQLWPLDIPVLGGDTIDVSPAIPPGA